MDMNKAYAIIGIHQTFNKIHFADTDILSKNWTVPVKSLVKIVIWPHEVGEDTCRR